MITTGRSSFCERPTRTASCAAWQRRFSSCCVLIETMDLVFAVDSIPAVFAVTRVPFLVYTSNVAAILGLRSLYFLLAGAVGKLRYLTIGLACILVFVGLKMLAAHWYAVPTVASLGVIVVILGSAALASTYVDRRSAV